MRNKRLIRTLSTLCLTLVLASGFTVPASAGGGAAPWAKAGTVKPDASTSVRQRAESVLQILLFFISGSLLII